ncbi:cation:proton antiporter [Candidatus Woesearchaeota archaeon]|nr:cation:proton antiporter [Candidatus Woesearchaeota archaeon]
MVDVIVVAAICLFVSFIFGDIFHRIKYPRLVGQILAGVIMVPLFATIFTPESAISIKFLSDLGIIFLLFLTAMRINIKKLEKATGDALAIAILSAGVPFILGFAAMRLMHYSTAASLVVAAGISVTSEATKTKILLDLKALHTKVGLTTLAAAIMDDMFHVIFLASLFMLASNGDGSFIRLPFYVLIFVSAIFIVNKIFPYIHNYVHKEHSRIVDFSVVILFGLFAAILSKSLGFGTDIGAFIAGIIINMRENGTYEFTDHLKTLELVAFTFIIPFFFINIGLHFDYSILKTHLFPLTVILVVALAGKIGAAFLAKPFTSLSFRQLHFVGWAMNTRGTAELVLAEAARLIGLISAEVYSMIIFVAIVTTLLVPLVLKHIIGVDHKMLD